MEEHHLQTVLESQGEGVMSQEWWLSTRRMTFQATVNKGIVVDAAPIARRFIGQSFKRLKDWLRRQGGFRTNCIKEDTRI